MNINNELYKLSNYLKSNEKVIINDYHKSKKLNIILEENNNKILDLKNKIKEIDKEILSLTKEYQNIILENDKLLKKEDNIYHNELIRIEAKKSDIKIEYTFLINEKIKEILNNQINILNLKREIKEINDNINEYKNTKIIKRKLFLESINNLNKNIKNRRLETQNINTENLLIKEKINSLYTELYNLETLTNPDNDIKKKKINAKINQLKKLIKINSDSTNDSLTKINKNLLNFKMPFTYKDLKNILKKKNKEMQKLQKIKKDNNNLLIELENKITDEYINNLLDNEIKRCINRFETVKNRINLKINDLEYEYKIKINNYEDNKKKLLLEINNLTSFNNNNKNNDLDKIQKEKKIIDSIKNRINYLKIINN